MRENRTYGSEGGEGPYLFPTPIGYEHEAARFSGYSSTLTP